MTVELPMLVVFCSSGLDPTEVEPDFASEHAAATASGYTTVLVDHDELVSGSASRGVSDVGRWQPAKAALYRGWMLPVARYEAFYRALEARGISLINTPSAYRACHLLPETYPIIEPLTPETAWIPLDELMQEGRVDWARVAETAARFGAAAVIVKDYVKSQKHQWGEACYIPRANDTDAVRRVVERFLELQGDDLAGGLVIRRYVRLRQLGVHAQSGMPLGEEYRLFIADGQPIITAPYWDADGRGAELPTADLVAIARQVPSRFFSMDVARGDDGRWWIIELGDGQVAGLPPGINPARFYQAISERWGKP